MPIGSIIMRAAIWSGSGAIVAILANAAIGEDTRLLPASFLGAAIGSMLGWMRIVGQARLATQSRD
jgi:hypothetical protein